MVSPSLQGEDTSVVVVNVMDVVDDIVAVAVELWNLREQYVYGYFLKWLL